MSGAATVDPRARAQGRKTVKLGDTGDEVLLGETKLYAAIGEPSKQLAGTFGSETEDAVKKFQGDHGLQVDGVVGPQTWAALDAVAGERAPADEVAIEELRRKKKGADALRDGGDFAGAEAEYQELYARRDVPPLIRLGVTFGLATCEQAQGRFERAISLYREYVDLPTIDEQDRADALERIRECRAKQQPGKLESEISTAATVPPVEPG